MASARLWIWDLAFLVKRVISTYDITAWPWDFLLNSTKSERDMKKAGLVWHMMVTDIESSLIEFPFPIPAFLAAWVCYVSYKMKNWDFPASLAVSGGHGTQLWSLGHKEKSPSPLSFFLLFFCLECGHNIWIYSSLFVTRRWQAWG